MVSDRCEQRYVTPDELEVTDLFVFLRGVMFGCFDVDGALRNFWGKMLLIPRSGRIYGAGVHYGKVLLIVDELGKDKKLHLGLVCFALRV